MKETSRYYRSHFRKMQERGWTVIPWESGQPNQVEVLTWLRTHGNGEFYYCAEPNKLNFAIVIKKPEDAVLFKRQFSVPCNDPQAK